jgi:glycosyltransferase involved in cell wall biosynthesis
MKVPLISVVIPTFNRPSFIERACNTVINQSYKNIEIIIVDDASNTSYSDAIKNIPFENLVYIRRDSNGGGSAARNTGIEAAKGDFIAFLDDDDEWLPQKLEKQIKSLSNNCQASQCGYTTKHSSQIRVEKSNVITLEDLRQNNKLASTTGLLCEKKILKDTMFDSNLHRAQDWDIYIRIAMKTNFAYINEPLYIYDDGDHARMSNKFSTISIEDYKLRLDMLKKHRKILTQKSYINHVAELILPSLKTRKDKAAILKFSIEEIGIVNTIKQLGRLAYNSIRR